MKVRITPDGAVELDISGNGDGQAALDMINAIQANAKRTEKQGRELVFVKELAHLNRSQRQTYDALVEFDSVGGVHVSSLAVLLETTEGAVQHRISLMMKHGLVERITRGHYRAVNVSELAK